MTKIYLEPDEVWNFFIENFNDYESKLIAEDPEYGITIWLEFKSHYPSIVVNIDSEEYAIESAFSESACQRKVAYIYDTYLGSNLLNELNFQEEMNDREELLDELVENFIIDVTDLDDFEQDDKKREDIIKDIKEHILAYMYRKHGLEPYRPMILKTADGEVHEDYPYSILCS